MSETLSFVQPGTGDDEPPGPPGRKNVSNRTLIVSAAAVFVVAALVTWLVAFSPVLGAKNVEVVGGQHVTAEQVREAAAIKHGTPLVRLDTAAVERRVEALPDVASARVRTSFPTGVVITVTERRPVGFLQAGARFVLIDRTGKQYRRVSAVPTALPRFVVPDGPGAIATGRALATVAAALPAGLRARVSSIEAFDPTAITLVLIDQRVVRWGTAERSADKARILPTLLGQPGSRFDVTNPDLVVAH